MEREEDKLIEHCNFSKRTLGLLRRLRIKRVSELANLRRATIKAHGWHGQETIPEIERALGDKLLD